jgi:transposase
MMKPTATKAKRQDRTIVLYLGNTLADYKARFLAEQGIPTLIARVETADSLNWGHLANGHKAGCPRRLHFTHHNGYTRSLGHFNTSKSSVPIQRVRCLDCGAVFTILPSFVVRYKRYDTDAIEKLMTLLFITEDSYRMAGVSQALGLDTHLAGTWTALAEKTGEAIAPRALWSLVQWFGQLSPAQLNLTLGVAPPTHIIEDEKHVQQSGDKAYVPIVYALKEALIWWIDYLQTASEADLKASLERFKALSERLAQITGATVDGWEAAQNALRAAFPGITLEECHMHAMIKLGQHLATYKRQRQKENHPLSESEETAIRDAFWRVLKAPTPEVYQKALNELPAVFEQGPLASRKASLIAKQALFQAWITDDRLAVVTTALDQCMKFLDRKQENMQTFHGEKSGLATVNAWAITRNCWRFLKGAKRAGMSPLELARGNFLGIPWMQLVNLILCAWPTLALAGNVLRC